MMINEMSMSRASKVSYSQYCQNLHKYFKTRDLTCVNTMALGLIISQDSLTFSGMLKDDHNKL